MSQWNIEEKTVKENEEGMEAKGKMKRKKSRKEKNEMRKRER